MIVGTGHSPEHACLYCESAGILISGEQQQFPDGKYVGLLPDSIALASQERRPWMINPCAMVSLRLVLDGRLDSLSVAQSDKHRVVAPFPVTIADDPLTCVARGAGSALEFMDQTGHDLFLVD